MVLLKAIQPGGQADPSLTELIRSSLNWSKLFELAANQGVFPLLYHCMQSLPGGCMPPQITEEMHSIYQSSAHRSLGLALRLIQLVDLLSSHGIDALAMKGPALAEQAYGSLELRSYCDLDILIHREDFPQVYTILVQNGYQPDFPLLGLKEQKQLQQTDKDFKFTVQEVTFEIHWEIGDRGSFHPIKVEKFWETPATVKLLGKEIRTFSLENSVWMACLHGTKHAWSQLKWVADLGHLIQLFPGQDWKKILDRARNTGFYRLICTSLMLAQYPGGVVLPEEVHLQIEAEPKAEKLAEKARGWLLVSDNPPQPFDRTIYFIQNRERTRDHIYYWLNWCFMLGRGDFMAFKLPGGLGLLRYVLRPFRLTGSYGRSFLRSVQKML